MVFDTQADKVFTPGSQHIIANGNPILCYSFITARKRICTLGDLQFLWECRSWKQQSPIAPSCSFLLGITPSEGEIPWSLLFCHKIQSSFGLNRCPLNLVARILLASVGIGTGPKGSSLLSLKSVGVLPLIIGSRIKALNIALGKSPSMTEAATSKPMQVLGELSNS